MIDAIATEVRDAAQSMAADGLGNLRIGGDGPKNADDMKDVDGLLEFGAVRYGGTGIRVDDGCASLFNRI